MIADFTVFFKLELVKINETFLGSPAFIYSVFTKHSAFFHLFGWVFLDSPIFHPAKQKTARVLC